MIHFAQLSFPRMLPIILGDKHNIWLCLSACLTPIWYDMNCWNFKNYSSVCQSVWKLSCGCGQSAFNAFLTFLTSALTDRVMDPLDFWYGVPLNISKSTPWAPASSREQQVSLRCQDVLMNNIHVYSVIIYIKEDYFRLCSIFRDKHIPS